MPNTAAESQGELRQRWVLLDDGHCSLRAAALGLDSWPRKPECVISKRKAVQVMAVRRNIALCDAHPSSDSPQKGVQRYAGQALVDGNTVDLRQQQTPLLQRPVVAGRREIRPVLWQWARLARMYRHGFGAALRQALKITPAMWQKRRPLPPEQIPADANSVVFVVPRLVISGGVQSIVQLANRLTIQGVSAYIATLFEDPVVFDWMPFLRRPWVYPSWSALCQKLPASSHIVATRHDSVAPVAEVSRRTSATPWYWVQDYEPWFHRKNTTAHEQAVESYQRIQNQVVKTDWLADKLRPFGGEIRKIPLGLDLDTFQPSESPPKQGYVLAMWRPGTAYRGARRLQDVFVAIMQRRPNTRFCLFGAAPSWELRNHFGDNLIQKGVVSDSAQLVNLYQRAAVFVDASDFQGFGRCGLEAMACGVPTVLTNSGGVGAYANSRNCSLVNADDTSAIADAVIRLLDDHALASQQRSEGLKTAREFSAEVEAQRWQALLTEQCQLDAD